MEGCTAAVLKCIEESGVQRPTVASVREACRGRVPPECLRSYAAVKAAVALAQGRGQQGAQGQATAGGGGFYNAVGRPYTLAEAVYLCLYTRDPTAAHEAAYRLLEPLSLDPRRFSRLFVQIEGEGDLEEALRAAGEVAGVLCRECPDLFRELVSFSLGRPVDPCRG